MLSVLMGAKRSIGRILFLGSVYILAVLTVYLLAGLGLLLFLSKIPLFITEYIAISVGLIIIAAGLIEAIAAVVTTTPKVGKYASTAS